MKKGWKIFWIVCLIIALIGMGLCVAGIALGFNGKDLKRTFGDAYIEKTIVTTHGSDDAQEDIIEHDTDLEDLESYSNVNKLSIEMGAGEFIIKTYEGTDIRCDFNGLNTKASHLIEQDAGELDIEISKKHHWIGNADAGKVVLYIPKDLELQELSLDVGAGNVSIGDILADDIEMKCGAGKIEYSTSKAETDYNYNIECGIGEVTIGSSDYSGLGTEKTVNNGSKYNMDIQCGIGQIVVNFI